jgi:hypothetical protein
VRLSDLELNCRRRRAKLLTEALGGFRLQVSLPGLGTPGGMLG